MKELPYPYNQQQRPFNGAEEVYCEYYDTAGNYHWFGTMSGHHIMNIMTLLTQGGEIE